MEVTQFKVGDVVAFRTACMERHTVPKPFMVTETIVQTCHGGVQYQCRLGGYESKLWVACIELVAWDSDEVMEAMEAEREFLKERIRVESDAHEEAYQRRRAARKDDDS